MVDLVDGRPYVRELHITTEPGDPSITGEHLRTIRLTDLITANLPPDAPITPAEATRLRALGPTPETITAVATVYRAALRAGQPPTKTVRETFGISQSTAGNWIARARSADCVAPYSPRP
ncbi:hypothetical protein [Actinosynnema mirum]|uniref:hypothetical protein n=1 Tax=Actinosynnema mirum TaxID=40567 RepID=UPI00117D838C|nr:hypothetical protein [Actinosynnema mirum]